MAKRRVSKKRSTGKSKSTRRVKSKSVASSSKSVVSEFKGMPVRQDRIGLVTKNLVVFGILFIISMILAYVSNEAVIYNLFVILAILTGFVAVAFLIVLLIIIFSRQMKK